MTQQASLFSRFSATFGRGKLYILLLGALLGVLLLLFGSSFSGSEASPSPSSVAVSYEQLQTLEDALEKELATICSEVAGVGHVEVLVRLEGGARTQYATDESGKLLSTGSAASREPLVAGVLSPRVAGVAVVCRGGGDPSVQQRLTDLISTALGISAARVFVCGK